MIKNKHFIDLWLVDKKIYIIKTKVYKTHPHETAMKYSKCIACFKSRLYYKYQPISSVLRQGHFQHSVTFYKGYLPESFT